MKGDIRSLDSSSYVVLLDVVGSTHCVLGISARFFLGSTKPGRSL